MLIDLFIHIIDIYYTWYFKLLQYFDLFKFSFYTLLGRSRVTFSICLILSQYLGKDCLGPWHNGLWIKKFPCWLGGEYVPLCTCMSPQHFTLLLCRRFHCPKPPAVVSPICLCQCSAGDTSAQYLWWPPTVLFMHSSFMPFIALWTLVATCKINEVHHPTYLGAL